jgi:hypothetical protein
MEWMITRLTSVLTLPDVLAKAGIDTANARQVNMDVANWPLNPISPQE